MQDLVRGWSQKGWVAPWNARIGRLGKATASASSEDNNDFFGLPSRTEPVYIGVGGMHQLPRKILKHCPNISVHRGTRVSGIERDDKAKGWKLLGVSGEAAYHDTNNEQSNDSPSVLDTVDAVLFTDRSSAFDSWHRASAGIPTAFQQQLLDCGRARVPLFSCMVALSHSIREHLSFDAFTSSDGATGSSLWFAACSQSKPGFPVGAPECWTLVSTPLFAVNQIQETTMQDPVTRAFRPQEDEYLNNVPGPLLWNAFCDAVKPSLEASGTDMPEAVYLQAQRWGSGLPAPPSTSPENIVQVCGVDYAQRIPSLVFERPAVLKSDFVANNGMRLFAAGDFTSQRCPGFEAAALAGVDVAQHMIEVLGSDDKK